MSGRNGGLGRLASGLGIPPGPVVGAVAYAVTYLLTFALAVVDGVTAEGVPTWTVVGWLVYGAHHVTLRASGVGSGGGTVVDALGGTAGPTGAGSTVPLVAYYLVPAVVLVLAGGYVYSLAEADVPPSQAPGVGATVLVGYVVLAALGTVLFAADAGGSGRVAPDPVTGVVVAGLLYPFLFGALGGGIAAWRE